MRVNYYEEYCNLVKDVKYKLSKLYLPKDKVNEYLTKINEIESYIASKKNDFGYYEAFLKITKLEEELTKLISSNPNLLLPPYENKSYLKKQRKSLKIDIKNNEKNNNIIKLKLISYFLSGSILLTLGAYTISNEANRPKDKLYLTEKHTYIDSTNNTKLESEYLKQKQNSYEVMIKKITPWENENGRYQRHEYIYKISNMSYHEIISSKDYEKIIANLSFIDEIIYKDEEDMLNINRGIEPTFEVIEITQNNNDYIERRPYVSGETIMALFMELLAYILIVNLNEGPLFESILVGCSDIKNMDKITDAKKATLKMLKEQYRMLNTPKKMLKKQ